MLMKLSRSVFAASRFKGGFLIAASLAITAARLTTSPGCAVTIDLLPAGNAGNAIEPNGCGAAAYVYQIGKYVVTIAPYAAFLDAASATVTYSLSNASMATSLNVAGISRGGSSGSYAYGVIHNGSDSANRSEFS
jgi:hypothetical protein